MKYLILTLGVIFAVTAQLLLKSLSFYNTFERKWLLVLIGSVIAYGMAFLTQIFLYKTFQLHKISPFMSISIMLLVVMSSIVFYNETIELKQIFGIFLGVFSMYLILS